MLGLASQRWSARWMNASSRSRIASTPTAALSPNTRPARIDSTMAGRAALLAVLDVGEVDVLDGVDVGDRAAAGHRRHAVAEQLPARDEHARRPGPADELVGRDEHRVLAPRAGRRPGPSRSPRTAPPPRSRRTTAPRARGGGARSPRVSDTMPVTFEAAENDPIFSGRSAYRSSSSRSCGEVDVALAVLADHHHVRDGLPPRQLVAVVLVGADEHDRPLVRAGSASARSQRSSRSAGMRRLSTSTSRLIAAGGAGAAEDHRVARRGPRRRPRGRGAVPPRGSVTSGGPCRTTRCGCSRTAAGPPRGCSPR